MSPFALAHAEEESLTQQEQRQWRALRLLRWVPELRADQARLIGVGLESPRDPVVEVSVDAVAVHRLASMKEILAAGVGRERSQARRLGDAFAAALTLPRPLEALKAIYDWGEVNVQTESELNARVQKILVVNRARFLRGLPASDVEPRDVPLTHYEGELLRYAAMPKSDAVESLIERLAAAEVSGVPQYDLLMILQSYGSDCVSPVLNRFRATDARRPRRRAGRNMLLRAVEPHIEEMDPSQRRALRDAMTDVRTKDPDLPILLHLDGELAAEEGP